MDAGAVEGAVEVTDEGADEVAEEGADEVAEEGAQAGEVRYAASRVKSGAQSLRRTQRARAAGSIEIIR